MEDICSSLKRCTMICLSLVTLLWVVLGLEPKETRCTCVSTVPKGCLQTVEPVLSDMVHFTTLFFSNVASMENRPALSDTLPFTTLSFLWRCRSNRFYCIYRTAKATSAHKNVTFNNSIFFQLGSAIRSCHHLNFMKLNSTVIFIESYDDTWTNTW